MRLRFNLMVAWSNYAAFLAQACRWTRRTFRRATPARSARDALDCAADEATEVSSFLNARRTRKNYPELWDELCAAVSYVVDAMDVEWKRRFTDVNGHMAAAGIAETGSPRRPR